MIKKIEVKKLHLFEILLFLIFMILSSPLIYLFNQHLDRNMNELKSKAIEVLEARLGREISYESISPSVFGFIAVRELRIHSFSDPEAVLLHINKVKIYYNLFNLLLTKDPLSSLTEVRLANSRFLIDSERDKEILELLNRISGKEQRREMKSIAPALKLSGANISVSILTPDLGLKLEKLFFSVSLNEGVYSLSVRTSLQLALLPGTDRTLNIFSRVKINGKLDQSLDRSDLAVRMYSLTTKNLTLGRQTFQVILKGEKIEIRKIQDHSPLDLHLILDLPSNDLTFNFKSEDFRPSSAFRFTGELEQWNRFLESSITSTGSMTYNIDSGATSYLLDFEAGIRSKIFPPDLKVSAHLYGNEKLLYLDPLLAHSGQGTVEFVGNVSMRNLFPAGFLQLIDIRSFYGESLNAAFKLERGAESLKVRGSRLVIGSVDFDAFDLEFVPAGKYFNFTLSSSISKTRLPNSIKAAGKLSLSPRPTLEAEAGFSDIPLDILYRLLIPEKEFIPALNRFLQPLLLSMTLTAGVVSSDPLGRTDFKNFELTSSDVRLADSNDENNSLRLSFTGNNRTLSVNDISVDWQDYELSGLFRTESVGNGTSFSSSLTFEKVPYEFQGSVITGKKIELSGSYGLKFSWLFSGQGSPHIYPESVVPLRGSPFELKTGEFPLPFKEGTMLATIDLVGIRTREGFLYAVSRQTEMKNIPIFAVAENRLAVTYSLKRNKLSLERVIYEDENSTLEGGGEFELSGLKPVTGRGVIELGSKDSPEHYYIVAEVLRTEVKADFSFQHAPLRRLGEAIISGAVSGSVSAQGELTSPEVEASLVLNEGRLNLDPLSLELSMRYSENRLSLEILNLEYLTHRIFDGQGWVGLESGEFEFLSGYRADYFGDIVDLKISLTGSLKDPVNQASLKKISTAGLSGTLRLSDIRVQDQEQPDWIVSLETKDEILFVDGGPNDAIHGQFSDYGVFTLNLLDPLPIQGTAAGKITGGRIESTFNVARFDMQVINAVTYTDIFAFTQGSARGTLRITGPINDPDYFGTLEVSGGELLFIPSPDPVSPINGRLVFDEKSFTMERVSSFCGSARVTAEGIFYIDHWVPDAIELTFWTESEPGIRVRYKFGRVYTDGYVSGVVRVTSDENSTRIEGDLYVDSCRIALEDMPPESEKAVPLTVSMNFRTGSRVEFYWPSFTFPIVRGYAKQGERVSLEVDGMEGRVVLKGEVEIRGGEIFYFDRSFYVKEGSITFGEPFGEPANVVDPLIKVLAEIRERDQNNEEIRIYMEVNNRLSQFSPRFYSEPSRPDMEIMDYIGGSIFNRIEEIGFGISAAMLTSDVVSQFGILSPFEQAVRELLGLDLFRIRTQVVQNVLIGKLLGENFSSFVINPLDNTTLSLGKYLGTDLFLEMLVRFQAVDVLSPDHTAIGQIQTEGEINFEWATPFFLLEWTFAPSHPEDLFLTDNTIGLKWRFSY